MPAADSRSGPTCPIRLRGRPVAVTSDLYPPTHLAAVLRPGEYGWWGWQIGPIRGRHRL